MGFLSKILSRSQNNTTLIQQQKHELQVLSEYNKTRAAIDKGLSKKTASTGRPIDEIYGNARTNAIISNCGGGSKATGGNGVQGGIDLLVKHGETIGRAKEIIRSKKLDNKK